MHPKTQPQTHIAMPPPPNLTPAINTGLTMGFGMAFKMLWPLFLLLIGAAVIKAKLDRQIEKKDIERRVRIEEATRAKIAQERGRSGTG